VRVVITLVSVIFTRIHVKITLVETGNHTLRVKLHSAWGNRTLRVEINFMRVEITLVRVGITLVCVGITFVPVETTLRVEIALCVSESLSSV
jgi:hypothetical protein